MFCSLQMFSIRTSLQFCRLVEFNRLFHSERLKIILQYSFYPKHDEQEIPLKTDSVLSHKNSCFPCNIAITNFLVLHTCEIKFYDVIDRTVHMFTL